MIGRNFDDFTIIDKISKGGMGEVYLAVQNSLDRNVAIKIIFCNQDLQEKELIERFIREAKLTASIQHPNVVNIYKVGQHEDFFYIAMEYISWSSLEEQLKDGAMDEKQSWEIVLQVCLGLQKTLQNGIIHRDIKPGNILLQNPNHAILTDFGLSKQLGGDVQITQMGMILGTPAYISPEQVEAKKCDFRSDIYSLGATVFHMLTGKTVFDGDSSIDILCKHKTESPISPKRYKSDLTKQSTAIIAKMLQKKPEKRYQSYGDLIIDIQCLLSDKPLVFASYEDSYTCYQKSTVRSSNNTTKALKSFFSFLGKDFANVDNKKWPFIWLERNERFNTLTHKNSHFHVMSSYSELETYLSHSSGIILLESGSLCAETINFIYKIQKDFPESPVCIMMNKITEAITNSECKSFFMCKNHSDLEKQLIEHYNQKKFHCMRDVCLDVCILLGRFYKWTLCLCDGEDSKIYMHQGEVKNISQNELVELTKTQKKWRTISRTSSVNTRTSQIHLEKISEIVQRKTNLNPEQKMSGIAQENPKEVVNNTTDSEKENNSPQELDVDALFERMAAKAEKKINPEKHTIKLEDYS